MLIGILTFLSVENCGALLQAYALSTTLKNMGNDVELVNIISNNEKSRKGLKVLKNNFEQKKFNKVQINTDIQKIIGEELKKPSQEQ